jgi:hypothetical protein
MRHPLKSALLVVGGIVFLAILTAFVASAQQAPINPSTVSAKASWMVESDHPDKKVIVRLDTLPDDFVFEFWFGGDAPHITKAQLAEALEMYQARRVQSDKPCVLTQQGGILNYPCKVRNTQPHSVAVVAKKK